MISTVLDGKVLDWHFKKQNDFTYTFYIGYDEDQVLLGQIFKMSPTQWSAVSWVEGVKAPYNNVDGFRSRYYAASYLNEIYCNKVKRPEDQHHEN